MDTYTKMCDVEWLKEMRPSLNVSDCYYNKRTGNISILKFKGHAVVLEPHIIWLPRLGQLLYELEKARKQKGGWALECFAWDGECYMTDRYFGGTQVKGETAEIAVLRLLAHVLGQSVGTI